MANDNETVNDIRAEVGEYLTSIGPSELPSETQVEEFADRFVAAHNREMNALALRKEEDASEAFIKNAELTNAIAAKDAEIDKLKFDNLHLKSVQRQAGEVIIEQTNKVEARDAEIEKLRALVKELADALEYNECYRCTYNCATCTCKDHKNALVAKAKEVCK